MGQPGIPERVSDFSKGVNKPRKFEESRDSTNKKPLIKIYFASEIHRFVI